MTAKENESKRVRANENLSESLKEVMDQQRALLNAIPDLIFRYSVDGTILDLKVSVEKFAPFSSEDIGKNIRDLFKESVAKKFIRLGVRAIVYRSIETLEYSAELEGGESYYEVRITASGPSELTAIIRDQTEKVLMEKEKEDFFFKLIQSAKMASLGTLAAGIAHELVNPLAVIKNYAQIISGKKVDNERVLELSSRILTSSERMEKIIDHMRIFSKKQKREDFSLVQINKIVKESFIFLDGVLNENNVQCKLNLKAKHSIFINDSHLEFIIQNFLTNSIDAFLVNPQIKDRAVEITTQSTDKTVELIYQDNAGGMSPDVQAKIFEPFFTTKRVGMGTGLGLSICYEIVLQHRGSIIVQSEFGKGTRFLLSFPVSKVEDKSKERDYESVS